MQRERPIRRSTTLKHKHPRNFIDYGRTRRAARLAGKQIPEYLETIWHCQGQAERTVETMERLGCLARCKTILEIGPGSGRFLLPVLNRARPERYEIYETAEDWAAWLVKSNRPYVVNQVADGHSLSGSKNCSCDLVHSHGVLVYLAPLTSFEYFEEMMRVCSDHGHIVFDFFPNEEFDERAVRKWLATEDRFPIFLPLQLVSEFFARRGFLRIAKFHRQVSAARSTYLVFRKQRQSTGRRR